MGGVSSRGFSGSKKTIEHFSLFKEKYISLLKVADIFAGKNIYNFP